MRPVTDRHVHGGGDDCDQIGILLIPIGWRGSSRSNASSRGSRLRRGFSGGLSGGGGFGCAAGSLLREEGPHGRSDGGE